MFTEECINTFLENQEQLFPQAVAESYEAAEAFLGGLHGAGCGFY